MILLEIIQDGAPIYVNMDYVLSVTEDPDDATKCLLWTSMVGDGEYFIADEPVRKLAGRIREEIAK